MILAELIAALEELAPPSLQESYDNSGLITGSINSEISGALICLDATEAVIREAIGLNFNLVIAHHPILFTALKKFTGTGYADRSVLTAIKNDVAIYCIHTNLDASPEGVNARICERLGLGNTRILDPAQGKLLKMITFVPHEHATAVRSALFAAGAGMIGKYDECSYNSEGYGTFRGNETTHAYAGTRGIQHREPETRIEVILPVWLKNQVVAALKSSHPYEEVAYDLITLENVWDQAGAGMVGELEHEMTTADFLKHLKRQMHTGIIRHTAPVTLENGNPVKISKVAVCGGSGSFLLEKALRAGVQAFVSADFKYHQFFEADNRILVCDIGHYESEQYTMNLLHDVIREKFPTFAARITALNTNPINYY